MQDITLTAAFTTKASATEDNSLVIQGMANTVAKDRAGDVIIAEAWTTSNALTNYMKNPIILAFHNHSLPIGTAISITPTEKGLEVWCNRHDCKIIHINFNGNKVSLL